MCQGNEKEEKVMEILELREINKGCLKSAFKLKMPVYDKTGQVRGYSLTECAYFEKDNGNFWLNVAPKEFTTIEGQKKTYNMHTWDEELTKLINRAVHEKIKKGDFQKKVPKQQTPSFDDSECSF